MKDFEGMIRSAEHIAECADIWGKTGVRRDLAIAREANALIGCLADRRREEAGDRRAAYEALRSAESILRYARDTSTNCGGKRPGTTTLQSLRAVRSAMGRLSAALPRRVLARYRPKRGGWPVYELCEIMGWVECLSVSDPAGPFVLPGGGSHE